MKAHDVIRILLIAAYTMMWVGGVVSYAVLGGPPEGAAWAAPLFLALAGAAVLGFTRVREWRWVGLAAAVGFASELCGVAFGFPYSSYHYTEVLGPAVLGVPLVLGAAWVVLAAHVQHGTAMLTARARPFVAAGWMTVIDLVIDPLAAGPLGYWRWEAEGAYFGVPLMNFAGWYVTSLVIFTLVPRSWQPHPALRGVGASVIAFFGVIALALGFVIPAVIAGLLLAVDAATLLRLKRWSAPAKAEPV